MHPLLRKPFGNLHIPCRKQSSCSFFHSASQTNRITRCRNNPDCRTSTVAKIFLGEMYRILFLCFAIITIEAIVETESNSEYGDPFENYVESLETRGTLDKMKVIRHLPSGRCLVIENGKRQGLTREHRVVLWKCHDSLINGLEQEMFSVVKTNGGGFRFMGNAGSLDKCIAASRGYNELVQTHRCDSLNEDQSWILRQVELAYGVYQIVHKSTGHCVRAPGLHDGAWVRVGDCDLNDERQFWRICGLNGSCDF